MSIARTALLAALSLTVAGANAGGAAAAAAPRHAPAQRGAAPANPQDSGGFVVRLGRDTTAVEHFTDSARRLVVDQVGRSPRVTRRRLTFDFAPSGALTHVSAVVTSPAAPAGAPPMQTIEGRFTSDSAIVEVRHDTSLRVLRQAVPSGAVVLISTPWTMYQRATMRLAALKADSLRSPLSFIGSPDLLWLSLRRLGPDSVVIETPYDLYHARIDARGRILAIVPLHGTEAFSVDRAASLDVDAASAHFAAVEKEGGALGQLSTRDTVQAAAGGASLWIDYGRPAKRGRTVFGHVVPFGMVWRTGANAATQFRTDKALDMGGTQVPAGFYTLWTVPSPDGWKLLINGETGQWGTEHKPDRDLYTVSMGVSALPEPVERFTISVEPNAQGGVIHMDWDTTRASVPFVVKP